MYISFDILIVGCILTTLIYILIFLCSLFINPSKENIQSGYCINLEANTPLIYRLNGFRINIIILITLIILNKYLPALIIENILGLAITACIYGILLSIFWYLKGKKLRKSNSF